MIKVADFQSASRNLDKIYKDEILPILTEVREVWDKLTMQYLDENNRRIAKRHDIQFLPSEKNALFGVKSAKKHLKITISVEEETERD